MSEWTLESNIDCTNLIKLNIGIIKSTLRLMDSFVVPDIQGPDVQYVDITHQLFMLGTGVVYIDGSINISMATSARIYQYVLSFSSCDREWINLFDRYHPMVKRHQLEYENLKVTIPPPGVATVDQLKHYSNSMVARLEYQRLTAGLMIQLLTEAKTVTVPTQSRSYHLIRIIPVIVVGGYLLWKAIRG